MSTVFPACLYGNALLWGSQDNCISPVSY